MERGVTPMMIELVKCPVVTEKSVGLLEINQYTFEVDFADEAPDQTIDRKLFQVEVMAVNTHRPPRRRRGEGIRRSESEPSLRLSRDNRYP
jgi:ribosomal protein L23